MIFYTEDAIERIHPTEAIDFKLFLAEWAAA
jgi:hypothetical protein